MSGFILRPASAADAPDIIEIWSRSFGDPPEFIAALLQEADLLSNALCAEAEDRVKSVMFAFEGLSLGGRNAAYLYALCTDPTARGLGMGCAVVRALAQRCFDRGAEIVFLSPADAGLAAWYERILGTRPLAAFADRPLPVSPAGGRCVPLSAEEYRSLRQSDVSVTQQLLTAQSVLHRWFGGSFLRIELPGAVALACAEPGKNGLLLRELLCPEELRPAAAAAAADYYGADRVLLRCSTEIGQNLVYIINYKIYDKSVISLDIPSFFYTLE